MKRSFIFLLVCCWAGHAQTQTSKPAAGAVDEIVFSRAEYDSITQVLDAGRASWLMLKADSMRLAKTYQDLLKRKRADSLRQVSIGPGHKAISLPATIPAGLKGVRDSIVFMEGAIRQERETLRSGGTLRQQMAATAKFNEQSEKRKQALFDQNLQLRVHKSEWEDSVAALKRTTASLSKAGEENGELRKRVWNRYAGSVKALTAGLDFSAGRIAELQLQGDRLQPYFAGNSAFATCRNQLGQFSQLAQTIERVRQTLNQPYTTAATRNALQLLDQTTSLTKEQAALVQEYKTSLGGYCRLTYACDTVVKKSIKYRQLDAEESGRLLAAQLAKVDARNYPFLYGELQRLQELITKKGGDIVIKIPEVSCQ